MHYAEVVALWYICIIKSICDLLKVAVVCLLTYNSTDSECTKSLSHYFITLLKAAIESLETLLDKDVEEIVCVWNQKGRRIAV